MGIALLLISSIYFMLPAYIANMAPVILRRFNFIRYPIDFGIGFRGKPLLGRNKTIGGVLLAVIAGTIAFYLQILLYKYQTIQSISLFDYTAASLRIGILLSLGAMLGDSVKSLFKRQLGIAPGTPWIPFDEIDFAIGALLLVSIVYVLPAAAYIIILIASPLLHIAANYIGFYSGIGKEKW